MLIFMKYDFTSILDRKGKDSIAVDVPEVSKTKMGIVEPKEGFDIIPMWVADMNFPVVPTITKALIERASHPAFGYFSPQSEYYEKIIKWHKLRNNVTDLSSQNIGYENSVLGAVVNALNVLASKGDNILLHKPTYVGFINSLSNNGYNMVLSPLVLDENNIWRMDFEDMEKKIIENNINVTVFCSPHNPCGRVWEKCEIEKAMELFKKHDVYVISDEIWSDIILPGYNHIPAHSVSEDAKNRTISIYAPSKTFNLAGLVGSYNIIYNNRLRNRIAKESSLSHYNQMNVLSMHALLGAYEPEGYEWIDELNEVIANNIDTALGFINNFKGVTVSRPQGTYMLLINCTEYLNKHCISLEELLVKGYEYGVYWQSGEMFNAPNCIRINFALPNSRVIEAMQRLKDYVFVD